MRAACLLVVLLVARVLVAIGGGITLNGWVFVALTSHDVAVAAAAWTLDRVLRRPRVGWVVYGAAVAYVAVSVPITIVLGSPLTPPMMHAAGGALSDSIAFYVTAPNIARIFLVLLAGSVLPIIVTRIRPALARLPRAARLGAALIAAGVMALGSPARQRADIAGFQRNALTALLPIAPPMAHASSRYVPRDPALSDAAPADDLRWLRGSAEGMNVIAIVLESTAAQYLAPYGAPDDPMPNLTRLSRHALMFEHAYAVYPESIKGLFATLCSRDPLFSEPADVQAEMPCTPLAARLRSAGYRTGLFHSGRFGYLGMDAVLQRQAFETLEDAGVIGGNVHSSFGVDEPATVARIFEWVDDAADARPFFVTYLPIAGHHPYATPSAGPFEGDDAFSQYRNALFYGDQSIGDLLDGLKSRHLEDRTAIVVFGDHGEAFGQHAGNVGHTMFIYDENVRVPMMFTVPGATSRAVRASSPASVIDVAPTLLDLLGLADEPRYQGVTLLDPRVRTAMFFADYSMGWLGLRDGCWKFHLETGSGRARLFDVCRDPGETIDVAREEPARADAYRARVTAWGATLTRSVQSP